MVHIVSSVNRAGFASQIAQMHRDRKRIFVDWLKWSVPIVDGEYEIDQFDDDQAIYLIDSDPVTGQHRASMRLLPTTRPHLLQEVFPQLCDEPVPVGDHVMELTRLCISPDVPKADAASFMNHVWVAALEFALLYGIARYTCCCHMQLISTILSSGWNARLLGTPKEIEGRMVGAIIFPINPASLLFARQKFGYRAPVLDVLIPAMAA